MTDIKSIEKTNASLGRDWLNAARYILAIDGCFSGSAAPCSSAAPPSTGVGWWPSASRRFSSRSRPAQSCARWACAPWAEKSGQTNQGMQQRQRNRRQRWASRRWRGHRSRVPAAVTRRSVTHRHRT